MRTMKRTSLPLLLVLLGVLACAVPAVPIIDQNAAGTAVQETLSAIIKQTQDAGENIVDVSSDTPAPSAVASATLTAIPPSFTPTFTPIFTSTATETSTPTLIPTATRTSTPSEPMVSVSVPTNCRVGPGKIYQLVGGLPSGKWVRVYARDPGGDYWYIRNPDKPTQYCWIWGEYATVIGPIGQLPVYTPPPTPTPTMTSTPAPDFEASYQGLESCSNRWWADLKLRNTGSSTFRSMTISLRDTVTTVMVTLIADDFVDRTGCNSSIRDVLAPGKAATASSAAFTYLPSGHKISAIVTLCTNPGMNGMCVTRKFSFKP